MKKNKKTQNEEALEQIKEKEEKSKKKYKLKILKQDHMNQKIM